MSNIKNNAELHWKGKTYLKEFWLVQTESKANYIYIISNCKKV